MDREYHSSVHYNYLCKCSFVKQAIFVNLYLTSWCNLVTTIQRIPRISFYTWQTWLHLFAKDTYELAASLELGCPKLNRDAPFK